MIGSDFALEVPRKKYCDSQNNIGKFKLFYTQLGRDAIAAALSLVPFAVEEILLPSYLCDSTYNVFKRYDIKRYEIDESFKADLNNITIRDNSVVFVANYFGLSDERALISTINRERGRKRIFVIYDITHSLFDKNNFELDVDCLVASLRKWCAVPDGGLLAHKSTVDIQSVCCDCAFVDEKTEAMIMKKSFIDTREAIYKDFKSKFDSAEARADNPFLPGIKRISSFSMKMLGYFDYEDILRRRTKNFMLLSEFANFEYAHPCYNSVRGRGRRCVSRYTATNGIS